MTDHLTEADLKELEDKCNHAWWFSVDKRVDTLIEIDIPKLIARIRELEASND